MKTLNAFSPMIPFIIFGAVSILVILGVISMGMGDDDDGSTGGHV